MTPEMLNMTPEQRHRIHIANITKEVNETQDFNQCIECYNRYYILYKECGPTIIAKLLELSRSEGAFSVEKIKQLVRLFDKYNCYWQELLLKIFHNFNDRFIQYYESCDIETKSACIEMEAKKHIATMSDHSRLTSIYPVFVKIFPQLKPDIDTLFNKLCYKKGKLDQSMVNQFAKYAGSDNPHIRYMKNTFFKKCLKNFTISSLILAVSICITFTTEEWWLVGIFGVTMLATASGTIAFLFVLFSAIGNYFKDSDFNFSSIVTVYEKKNGKGHYKAVEIE